MSSTSEDRLTTLHPPHRWALEQFFRDVVRPMPGMTVTRKEFRTGFDYWVARRCLEVGRDLLFLSGAAFRVQNVIAVASTLGDGYPSIDLSSRKGVPVYRHLVLFPLREPDPQVRAAIVTWADRYAIPGLSDASRARAEAVVRRYVGLPEPSPQAPPQVPQASPEPGDGVFDWWAPLPGETLQEWDERRWGRLREDGDDRPIEAYWPGDGDEEGTLDRRERFAERGLA